MVMEFLLAGFSDVWELRILHALLFLLIYLATLIRNLIVTVTILNQSLHTSMYFFLRNLSVLDMCYISVTVSKAFVVFLLDDRWISMGGCAVQIFLMFFLAFTKLLFLTIMAHDCFMVICQPLHYPVIMNPQACIQMTLASIFSGVVYARFHTGNTFHLSFCQSNMVYQFFCDILSLLKLSCSDTFTNVIVIFVSTILFGCSCFAFITMSYICIFSTVLKFKTSIERGKAFHSCVPHILVVIIFLSSGFAVYMNPTSNVPSIQDMIISIFYSIIPPFMNPIICSLRNKQIKGAVRRILRSKYSGK